MDTVPPRPGRLRVSVWVMAAAIGLGISGLGPAGAAVPAVVRAAVPAPPSTPAQVLAPTSQQFVVGPKPAAVAASKADLVAALDEHALGGDVAASVINVATGGVLYARGETRPQHPASTLKILTALAVLHAYGPDARIDTLVVPGATPRDVVLVGGGDSTLTRVPTKAADLPAGQSAMPASMEDLATQTAKSLRLVGITSVRVSVDDSLFTGPRVASGWPTTFVTTGVVSPVEALSVDGGRKSATTRTRDSDPAISAGQDLAKRLRARGIKVDKAVTRVASHVTTPLGRVQSPTIAELLERALTQSDNDLAESLAHLAGLKLAGEASFAGGALAVQRTLVALNIPTTGLSIFDGSGLSARDLVMPQTTTHALMAAAQNVPDDGSTAGVYWPAFSGLPIAGVTGTLTHRFVALRTTLGRGLVRAKTGTLSGVIGLAGLVRDSHGRLLAFAFAADRSPGPLVAAQAALDRAASVLAAS